MPLGNSNATGIRLNMRRALGLSLYLLCSTFAAAPAPLTVAVYDFAPTDKTTASYAQKVTAFVAADLTLETNLAVLARANLGQALSEQAFGLSGLVNSEAAAKIGRLCGAKVLVSGQVVRTEGNHAALVANIIGTETGRLFAAKVEGAADQPMDLSAQLSRQIAQTIAVQTAKLVAAPGESRSEWLARIVQSVKGTNRPAVSITILNYVSGRPGRSATGEGELGALLLAAGFPVVDANSERKPNVEISGVEAVSSAPPRGGLVSSRAVLDLKMQERRTGALLALDHAESTATDIISRTAIRAAQADAVDQLAERILPLLAK